MYRRDLLVQLILWSGFALWWLVQDAEELAHPQFEQGAVPTAQIELQESTPEALQESESPETPNEQTSDPRTERVASEDPSDAGRFTDESESRTNQEPAKPIERMSDQEIEEILSECKERMKENEIRLLLDLDLATPKDLTEIAQSFLLRDEDRIVSVGLDGSRMELQSPPEANLVCKLHPSKWPAVVRSAATELFFAQEPSVHMVFSKRAELMIYRVLSDEAEKRTVQRTEYLFRLQPRAGGVGLVLLRSQPLKGDR